MRFYHSIFNIFFCVWLCFGCDDSSESNGGNDETGSTVQETEETMDTNDFTYGDIDFFNDTSSEEMTSNSNQNDIEDSMSSSTGEYSTDTGIDPNANDDTTLDTADSDTRDEQLTAGDSDTPDSVDSDTSVLQQGDTGEELSTSTSPDQETNADSELQDSGTSEYVDSEIFDTESSDMDSDDSFATDSDTICVPDCTNRNCGVDSVCGISCGQCGANELCSSQGTCECVPQCGDRECGADPICGVSCGGCDGTMTCSLLGQCEYPSVTFAGGDLDDLKSISSTLDFNDLTITGRLLLADYDNLNLHVSNLLVTDDGSIYYDEDICGLGNAPNVTIEASGTVTLRGMIDLDGGRGEATLDSATCNYCGGGDGGNVAISAQNIYVDASISASGGDGSVMTMVVGSYSIKTGCDGGDGGDLSLDATNDLELEGRITNHAGNGGWAIDGDGDDGVNGGLYLSANSFLWIIQEEEPNYGPSVVNQVIPYAPGIVLRGKINLDEDRAACNTGANCWQIDFGNGYIDRLEDMFYLDVFSDATVSFLFESNWGDLDIFILSQDGQQVLAYSATADYSETLTASLDSGLYLVGLSFADNYNGPVVYCDGDICPNSYTLTFEP